MSSSSGDTQNGTTIIREGQAEIVFSNANEVFYNEVQEFNRDLSTAIINVWSERFLEGKRQKAELKKAAKKKEEDAREQESKDSKANEETNTGISILEALAATGLRSIRYAKEIPNAKHIVANDMEEAAVEAIKKNVAHNKVGSIVTPSQGDACFVMYKAISEKKNFDVVDLDPYGSAVPFLDAAIRAVGEGGLLCVTCTDMAVLAGGQSESCWAKYGGMPIPNSPYCHEMGLRILLHCMQSTAARYKRYIVPLASCSIDFYVRVFVTVHTSAAEQKKAASKTGMVYHCPGCKSHVVQNIGKLVQNGNSVKYGTNPLPVGGPFFSGSMHDKTFIQSLLTHIKENRTKYKTHPRMLGFFTVISEELDVPFYYSLNNLAGAIHCITPPLKSVCSAILHGGYNVSITHTNPNCIKTDAPPSVLWDIMRHWEKEHPVKRTNIKEGDPAIQILAKEPSFSANFKYHPKADPPSRKIKLVRFQMNPKENWGPKAKAKKRAPPVSGSSEPAKKKPKIEEKTEKSQANN